MLNRMTKAGSIAVILAVAAMPALAETGPVVGQPAPAFTGVDSNGKTVNLADYRGKLVVLEWTNHDCPYVRKHYRAGNMQAVQKAAREMGAVWLSVISSAPGTQGHVSPAKANDLTKTRDAAPNRVILDPKGVIGRKYQASNTPHMYVIGPKGTLLYMGAIDDKPTAWGDPKGARNYVLAALNEIKAGKKVSQPTTQAYGCTVKYAY